MSDKSGYIGRIKNTGSQKIQAPNLKEVPKTGSTVLKASGKKDLRNGK